MSSIIQSNYDIRTYHSPAKASETRRAQAASFLDMAARFGTGAASAAAGSAASVQQTDTSQADAYKKYLEKRFGPVTIQSIGKDPASLEAAGKRMSGSDIIIAPNIFAEMVADPEKAACYEQKISYFFTDVIPKGQAFAAFMGLTFEPCGVVIHEDGTVTYICGGGDSPERVAEVNRINSEKAKKKAEQQAQYQEQAAAAADRRAIWEGTAEAEALEKTFCNIGDLLKTRIASAPALVQAMSLPAGTNRIFFRDL